VVVMTDGQNDDPGGISLNGLLSKLDGESGVRVFTVAYGKGADQGVLKKISETTNAAAYTASDPTSLDKVLAAVTSNF
jgi:Ca-activated chloride channel family protein